MYRFWYSNQLFLNSTIFTDTKGCKRTPVPWAQPLLWITAVYWSCTLQPPAFTPAWPGKFMQVKSDVLCPQPKIRYPKRNQQHWLIRLNCFPLLSLIRILSVAPFNSACNFKYHGPHEANAHRKPATELQWGQNCHPPGLWRGAYFLFLYSLNWRLVENIKK